MNHFFTKRKLSLIGAGGGGGSAPPPPVVTQYPGVLGPPQMGCISTITSFSYAETIDLLSDGPIEGLVNRFGQKLYDDNLKEGIYYNDVVIKEPSTSNSIQIPIDFIANQLKNLWYKNGEPIFFDAKNLIYESNFNNYDDQNFNSTISIKSYSPQISLEAYADIVGASINDLNLVKKAFELSPIKTEKPFLTIITIPSFNASLPNSLFDFEEGGFQKNYPIKISIPNISDYLYFSIGIDDLNSFNYFDLPRSYVFNNVKTISNNYTILKTKKNNALFNSETFVNFEFINIQIFIWSIYSEEFGVKDISNILDRYLNKLTIYQNNASLFNYPMTDIQFRKGSEIQTPLDRFSCILIDTDYRQELIGPFKLTNTWNPKNSLDAGGVQRVCSFYQGKIGETNLELEDETSDDVRRIKAWPLEYNKDGLPYMICDFKPNYAIFDENSLNRTCQPAFPITHYISNQNVESISVSLSINQLFDTNHADLVDPQLSEICSNKPNQSDKIPCGVSTYGDLGKINYSVLDRTRKYGYFLILNSPNQTQKESYIVDGGITQELAILNLRCLTNPYSDWNKSIKDKFPLYANSFTSFQEYNSNPKILKYSANLKNNLFNYLLINPNECSSLNTSIDWSQYCSKLTELNSILKMEPYKRFGFSEGDILTSKSSNEFNVVFSENINNSFIDYVNKYVGSDGYIFCLVRYCYLSVSNIIEPRYMLATKISNLIDPSEIWGEFSEDFNYEISVSQLGYGSSAFSTDYPYICSLAKNIYENLIENKILSITKANITQYLPNILLVGVTDQYLKDLPDNAWTNQSTRLFLVKNQLEYLLKNYALKINSSSQNYLTNWIDSSFLNNFGKNSLCEIACNINWSRIHNQCISKICLLPYNKSFFNDFKILNSNYCYILDCFISNIANQKSSTFDFLLKFDVYEKVDIPEQNSALIEQKYGTFYKKKSISSLDTEPDYVIPQIQQTITAGTRMPAVVSVKVEVGYESDGNEEFYSEGYIGRKYDIYGLTTESALIDLGDRSYSNINQNFLSQPIGILSNSKANAFRQNECLYLFRITRKSNNSSVQNFYIFCKRDIINNIFKNNLGDFFCVPFNVADVRYVNGLIVNSNFENEYLNNQNYVEVICGTNYSRIGQRTKYLINGNQQNNNLKEVETNDLDFIYSNIIKYFNTLYGFNANINLNSVYQIFDLDSNGQFNKLNLIEFYNSTFLDKKYSLEERKIFNFLAGSKNPVRSFSFSQSVDQSNNCGVDIYEINVGADSFLESSDAIKIEISSFIYDSFSSISRDNINSQNLNLTLTIPQIQTFNFDIQNKNYIYYTLYNVENYMCCLITTQNPELDEPIIVINKCEKELKYKTNSEAISNYKLCSILKNIYKNDLILECGSYVLRITDNPDEFEDNFNASLQYFKFNPPDAINSNWINKSINLENNKYCCCVSRKDFDSDIRKNFINTNLSFGISETIGVCTQNFIDFGSPLELISNETLTQNLLELNTENYSTDSIKCCRSSYIFISKKIKAEIISRNKTQYKIAQQNAVFSQKMKFWIIENLEKDSFDIFFPFYSVSDFSSNPSVFSSEEMNIFNLSEFYDGFRGLAAKLNGEDFDNMLSVNRKTTYYDTFRTKEDKDGSIKVFGETYVQTEGFNKKNIFGEACCSCLWPCFIEFQGMYETFTNQIKTKITSQDYYNPDQAGSTQSLIGFADWTNVYEGQFGTISHLGSFEISGPSDARAKYSTPIQYQYGSSFRRAQAGWCINTFGYGSMQDKNKSDGFIGSNNNFKVCKISIPKNDFSNYDSMGIAATIQSCFKTLGYIPTNAFIKNPRKKLNTLSAKTKDGNFSIFFAEYRVSNITSESVIDMSEVQAGEIVYNKNNILLPAPKFKEDGSVLKRYVKITKLSHETLSPMISKKILLNKVTEIIPQRFSYPFSALVGNKMDSRSFAQVPKRNYDCKLKKVLVPSNYYPLNDKGEDVRYLNGNGEYKIYDGDWDGTFKLMWTNNPAWIMMDLLINKRYGLGSHIESQQIDIWELYKIARWCDGVDDQGFYYGVPDGYSNISVEPRHTFNAILTEKFNVFDMLNQIANIFRGHVFYMNSLITFDDDRIKPIIGEFNNHDVKDGIFNYTNFKKDDEFTALDLLFLDEKDNFKPKKEYVEDSDGIKSRGLLKKEINLFGVTSRGQARRYGKHILHHTAKENLNVQFTTDLKALLYKPGDLISIHDELMLSVRNFGAVKRVKDIDNDKFEIIIDRCFDPNFFDIKEITLFTPIGKPKYEDVFSKSLPIPNQISFSKEGLQIFNPEYINGNPVLGLSIDSENPELVFLTRTDSKEIANTYSFEGSSSSMLEVQNEKTEKQLIPIKQNFKFSYIPEININQEFKKYGHWKLNYSFSLPNEENKNLEILFDNLNSSEIKFQFPHKRYFFEYFDTGRILTDSLQKNQQITGFDVNGLPLFGATNQFDFSGFSSDIINKFNFQVKSYLKPKINYSDIIENDRPSIETFYVTGINVNDVGYKNFTENDQDFSIITLSKYTKDGAIKTSVIDENGGIENIVLGSPYSLKILDKNPKIFKIMQITENYINEYNIVASEFNTGKFLEIEENHSIDDLNNSFNYLYGIEQVNKQSDSSAFIKAPIINKLETTKFFTTESNYLLGLQIEWFFETVNIKNQGESIFNSIEILSPSNKLYKVDDSNQISYDVNLNKFSTFVDLSKISKEIEVGSYLVRISIKQKDVDGNVVKTSPITSKNVVVLNY